MPQAASKPHCIFLAHSDFQSPDLTYVFIPLTAIFFGGWHWTPLILDCWRLTSTGGSAGNNTIKTKVPWVPRQGCRRGHILLSIRVCQYLPATAWCLWPGDLYLQAPLITFGELDRQYSVPHTCMGKGVEGLDEFYEELTKHPIDMSGRTNRHIMQSR